MIKLFILFTLLILNQFAYSNECDLTQQTAILLNSKFEEPIDCEIDASVLKHIEYHHAIGYGDTHKAIEILENPKDALLVASNAFTRIHILNLHNKHNEAYSHLQNMSPDLKAKEKAAYLIALSQTHFKLGNIMKAQNYFNAIQVSEISNHLYTEFEYELVKYELLSYSNNYPELLDQSDKYLAKLMNIQGMGNEGYNLLVVAYAFLAICKTESERNEAEARQYLLNTLSDSYADTSVFHDKLDKIIDLCE